MKRLSPLFALGLLCSPSVAAAQVEPGAAIEPSSSAPVEGNLAPPAPAGRTDSFLRGVAFDLEVGDEESQASAQIGGYSTRNVFSEGSTRQLGQTWALKLSVPFGGTDDLTSRASLDALTNGPKLTATYSIFGFRSGARNLTSPRFRSLMDQARASCERQADDQAAIDACRNAPPNPAFARRHLPGRTAEINRSLFSGIWRLGAEGAVSVNRFDFIDVATLEERDETKAQFSAALFGAYYPSDGMSAWIGRVEYQNAYEAGDASIICRPVVVDPADDCVQGVPTPPENVERLNLSVEHRRIFDTGWRHGSFAISPQATLDALSEEFELEFPVYFVPRGDWPVAPGFSVTYSSEKDEVDFGLFLRSTFSF